MSGRRTRSSTPRAAAVQVPATPGPPIPTPSSLVPSKVSHKTVNIEPFTGVVPDGAFDSGVRTWWRTFTDQVEVAQLLAGEVWTENQKKAVLSLHLRGTASRWYGEQRANLPTASLFDCGQALVQEFRSPLSDYEVIAKIREEKKRPDETYREFADRLSDMAACLDGGLAAASNARLALESFVRNAWWKFTPALKLATDHPELSAQALLDKAVRTITRLAESDGKARPIKRPEPATARRNWATDDAQHKRAKLSEPSNQKGGVALAAVVERKRRIPTGGDRKGAITCYACGKRGHIAAFCRSKDNDGRATHGPSEEDETDLGEQIGDADHTSTNEH